MANFESTYSGISYSINENNGVPYANKIITVNNSDYNLIDAHRIDWDNSRLTYTNTGSIDAEFITTFFEEINGKRERYKEMPSPSGDYTEWPSWYKEESCVNSTGDVLDIIDYLAYSSSYALRSIKNIYDSMNADFPILKYDNAQIENLEGKIDSDYNIRSYPIFMWMRPNQNNDNYVSTQKIQRYYSKKEERFFQLDLYVYNRMGVRISDPKIYFVNGDASSGNAALQYVHPENVKFGITAMLESSSSLTGSPGKFILQFTFDGWEANNEFKACNITANKITNKENYEPDNYRIVSFVCNTPDLIPDYKRSESRILTIYQQKGQNHFSTIFINNIRYIYFPENFFAGTSLAEYNNYVDTVQSGSLNVNINIKETYILNYDLIVDKSKINFKDKEAFIFYLIENGLETNLIPVTNYISKNYNRDGKRKGIFFANNSNIVVEIYPDFYGYSDQINGIDNVFPGAYDEGEFTLTNRDNNYLKNQSANYSLMVPLHHFVRNVNHYNNETTEFTNSQNIFNGSNSTFGNTWTSGVVETCQNCEREFDNVKHFGFKFEFRTSINNTTLNTIIAANNTNQLNNQPLIGYFDICVGTTATKFVGANFIKLRFIVNNSSRVYFIDKTKDYKIPSYSGGIVNNPNWTNPDVIANQWNTPKLYNGTKIEPDDPFCVLGAHNSTNSNLGVNLLLTESNIYVNNNQYYWDLSLPIFRYASWKKANEIIDNLTKSTLEERIYPTSLAPYGGDIAELSKPTGDEQLSIINQNDNDKFLPLPQNKSFDYNCGLPKIIIGDLRSNGNLWTQKQNQILIVPIILKTNNNYTEHIRVGEKFTIDFEKTYELNKDGFLSLCTQNFINKVKYSDSANTVERSDIDKGKKLCENYVVLKGDENPNTLTNKYLIFLQPTIPDNTDYWGYNNTYNATGEWEDRVQNGKDLYNKRFKLVLTIPENMASTSGEMHEKGVLILDLNVERANNDFAGWSYRRIGLDPSESNVLTFISIGKSINKSDFIRTSKFTLDNYHSIQTRNNRNISIANGKLINETKGIYELEVVDPTDKLLNITSPSKNKLYLTQTNNSFTLWTTEECKIQDVSISNVKYIVDDAGAIDFNIKVDGNNWFKGFYGRTNNDYRITPIQLSRSTMDFFMPHGNLRTNVGVQLFGSTLIRNLNENKIPGLVTNYGITGNDYSSGRILNCANIVPEISINEIKSSTSALFNLLNLINLETNFVDGGSTVSPSSIFGENWIKDYLKVSITVGITNNQNWPEEYEKFLNNNLSSCGPQTFKQILTKNDNNGYIYRDDTLFNKIYNKNGNNVELVSSTNIIKFENGGEKGAWLDLKQLINNRATAGDKIGLVISLMLPMTDIYRGTLHIFNLQINLNS